MNSRDLSSVEPAFRVSSTEFSSLKPILAKILDAISRDDFAAIADHLTEQVELQISGFPSMDGCWRGREHVMQALTANFDKVTEQKPEPESVIEQGNQIAMLIRESGRWKESGHPYRVRGVIWWTFDGNRLARVEEFIGPTRDQN
jgi:ketosteroid isomerase-like protein